MRRNVQKNTTMSQSKEKRGNEMYQNLGKLFYAVAMADQRVHRKEIEKLEELVREHWIDVDDVEDGFGTDAAHQINIVFDWLMEQEKSGNEAYGEFEQYYGDHNKWFTPAVKALALSTSRAIAAAFSGNNKAELLMLGRLQLLFDSQ